MRCLADVLRGMIASARALRSRTKPLANYIVLAGKLPCSCPAGNALACPGSSPGNIRAMSRQCLGNTPARSRQGPGKAPAMSRKCPGDVPAVLRKCPGNAAPPRHPKQCPGECPSNVPAMSRKRPRNARQCAANARPMRGQCPAHLAPSPLLIPAMSRKRPGNAAMRGQC